MDSSPSHIAILVPSVRKAVEYLAKFDFEVGEEETFEETREVYVNGQERNSILLMEPKGRGSYADALKKRGPGLHHLAIDVLNINEFLRSLSGSGWLLHLNSLNCLKSHKTAYLARPGFPGLIEVQETKKLMDGPLFVEEIFMNFDAKHKSLINAVGLDEILQPTIGNVSLRARGNKIELKDMF